jgi:hypothetical protein
MAYTLDFSIALGGSQTGLTLEAQLVNTAGANVGAAIGTGFTEMGLGNYLWHTTAIPDSHRGGVKFQLSGGGALKAFASINPQEAENTDVKTSTVVASSLIGPGAISHPVTVTEADLVTPIDGVAVWVTTDAAGANVIAGTLYTDALGRINGTVGFMLNAGTYYLWRERSGYNFANPTQFTVV